MSENNNKWIFQTNPDRYRMKDALLDLYTGRKPQLKKQTWGVNNQYKYLVKEGGIAFIWICKGKYKEKAGIYGVADIGSSPMVIDEFEYERDYWKKEEDKGKKELRVIIEITKHLVNKPLMERELKKERGLQNLPILKPRHSGTNFKVSDEEYVILSKLIKNR